MTHPTQPSSPHFIGIGHVRKTRNWRYEPHSHPLHHEFIVVLGGEIETQICGKILCGQTGDVLTYPAGAVHVERSLGETPLETLFISWTTAAPLGTEQWALKGTDPRLRIRMLSYWLEELHAAKTAGAETLDAILHAIIFEYQASQMTVENKLVQAIRQHILKHLADPIDLNDLANVAGMSRFHFCRQFKLAADETPLAFLRRMRMESAKFLLLNTPSPLKDIATQVGMTNEYSFSRVYRQANGHAPGQERKARSEHKHPLI